MNISEKQNDLLGRKELTAELEYEGATPSTAEVKKKIAEHYKVSEDAVAVKHIYTNFGKTKARVIAYLYKDEVTLLKVEPKKKEKKKQEAK